MPKLMQRPITIAIGTIRTAQVRRRVSMG